MPFLILLSCLLACFNTTADAQSRIRCQTSPCTSLVQLPTTPTSPFPADGATNVSLTPTLSCTASLAGSGFRIDIGPSSPPSVIVDTLIGATCNLPLEPLEHNTTYYWRIDACNTNGCTAGPIWSFTTLPAATVPAVPDTPNPSNGATGVSISPTFTCNSTGATSFTNFKFGTDNPPTNIVNGDSLGAACLYTPATLSYSTTYYWQVTGTNASGSTAGPVWSFTTGAQAGVAPAVPTSPSPANGASGVAIDLALDCTTDNTTTGITVKFDDVNPPVDSFFIDSSPGGVATCHYVPATTLAFSTTYYWQITASNGFGNATGPIWTFTTESEPAPPGTHGNLWVTPARTTAWAQMKTDYDAWVAGGSVGLPSTFGGRLYKHAKDESDAFFGYDNYGIYDAWLYKVTGNATYCQRAYDQMSATHHILAGTNASPPISYFNRVKNWNDGLGGNFSREYAIDLVGIYDWCFNAWNQTQRDAYLTKTNAMMSFMISNGPHRLGDVDQPTGEYMALAMWYYITRDYNPTIVSLWGTSWLGGITTTAANAATTRNILNYYATVSYAGGAGWDSSEYNPGTSQLMVLGLGALQTTDAAGSFSELEAHVPELAEVMTVRTTPDRLAGAQWGDEEHPRVFANAIGRKIFTPGYTFAGFLPDSDIRKRLLRHLADLRTEHGEVVSGNLNGEVLGKAYWMINPYQDMAADLSALSKGHFSSGYGMVHWTQDRTTDTGSYAWAHFKPGTRRFDHDVKYFGDSQGYRRGEWWWTHPIAYSAGSTFINRLAGRAYMGDMVNATVVEGISGIPQVSDNADGFQFNRIVSRTFGDTYFHLQATQSGGVHAELGIDGNTSYFDPPQAFIDEWTKSIFYLESEDETADTFVFFERIRARNPETLLKFSRYRPSGSLPEQTTIQNFPRWRSYIHPRTDPTITGTVSEWTTAGGQPVRHKWLFPALASLTITEQNESLLAEYDAQADEKKYRIVFEPTADATWNVLFHTVSARNSAAITAPTETLLSTTNNAYGVLIDRPGNQNVVIVLNGNESAELAQSFPTAAQLAVSAPPKHYWTAGSYQFVYTQTTADAMILLTDLDPSLTWAYTVNGGASTPITESNSGDDLGFEELTLSGTGAKTVVVTGS